MAQRRDLDAARQHKPLPQNRPGPPCLDGFVRWAAEEYGLRASSWVIQIEVIPGYTGVMKTAISLPDDTYEQATRQAQALGISRSEFFARAARSYLDQLASHSLTQQIDEALRTAVDDSSAAAAAAGRRYLAGQDDW